MVKRKSFLAQFCTVYYNKLILFHILNLTIDLTYICLLSKKMSLLFSMCYFNEKAHVTKC